MAGARRSTAMPWRKRIALFSIAALAVYTLTSFRAPIAPPTSSQTTSASKLSRLLAGTDRATRRIHTSWHDAGGCAARRRNHSSTFVYIGADVDVFALHFMLCAETRIIFIDPLIRWRNRARLDQLKQAAATKLRGSPAAAGDGGLELSSPQYHRLMECDNCTKPLQPTALHRFAEELAQRLLAAMHLYAPRHALARAFAARGSALQNKSAVADDIHTVVTWRKASDAPPTIKMRFIAAGVRRTLTYVVARSEDVDYAALLRGDTLSTVACTGTMRSHLIPFWHYICSDRRVLENSLRALSSRTDACLPFGGGHRQSQSPSPQFVGVGEQEGGGSSPKYYRSHVPRVKKECAEISSSNATGGKMKQHIQQKADPERGRDARRDAGEKHWRTQLIKQHQKRLHDQHAHFFDRKGKWKGGLLQGRA